MTASTVPGSEGSADRWENEEAQYVREMQSRDDLPIELKKYGITPVS
jgi:hypothetical protein